MTQITPAFKKAFDEALSEQTHWQLLTPNFETQEQEIEVLCEIHSEIFTCRPFALRWGRTNCPSCRREVISSKAKGRRKTSYKKFIENMRNNFGDGIKLITSEKEYLSGTENLEVACKIHGQFTSTVEAIRRGFGCKQCNYSRGERYIAAALDELQVDFEAQKKFESCRDTRPLPFDFWLPQFNALIEFQGRQHFEGFERWGGDEATSEVKRRDRIKRQWCIENEIPLKEISSYKTVKSEIVAFLAQIDTSGASEKFKKLLEEEKAKIRAANYELLKKLKKIHPDFEFDIEKNYRKILPKFIFYKCPRHGIKKGYRHNLERGVGCAECKGVMVSFDTFVSQAKDAHGQKFAYRQCHDDPFDNEIEVNCPQHGWQTMDRWQHLRIKSGCLQCSQKSKAADGSPDNFLQKAEKFNGAFFYCIDRFKAGENLKIKCIAHDIVFECLPATHIDSPVGACPSCVAERKSNIKGTAITVDGMHFSSITKCAEYYGIKNSTLSKRLREGMPIEKAVKFTR